ncbi:MAG: Rieske (2Fe-2S) protein [Planctomycetes bacterium]|nr:Rieske (2Fe-2S) protein [Planctomycetota bacterium]
MVARQRSLGPSGPRTLRIPLPARGSASFAEQAIASDPGDGVQALSSRCPHLGCRVDRLEGGELVCPCHGSRFALDGSLRRGPARDGLQRLAAQADPDGTSISIRIDA